MATQAEKTAFINMIATAVIVKCKEHGWGVPSAIIAQAALESNWGKSGLSTACFNFWGMKWREGCGTDYKEYKTQEQKTTGEYYGITAKFRKYKDVSDGIEGYFKFIESYSRYKPVMASVDYISYCNNIRLAGWATSLNYSNNLIKTVQTNNLTIFDAGNVNITAVATYTKGQTYKTNVELHIRVEPDGAKVKFDLITLNAKKSSKFDCYGNAILNSGTKVTCLDVKKLDTSTWIKIPSGWICAISGVNIYVS